MGQESDGLGEKQGEAGRQGLEYQSFTVGTGPSLTMSAVLGRCTTIKATGCVLAWYLCNAQVLQESYGNSAFVRTFLANSGVWHKVRRRRLALPICEGDLREFCMVSRKVDVETAASKEFVAKWNTTSWELLSRVACNFLAGAGGPLVPGKWNAAEERLAASIATTVGRFTAQKEVVQDDLVSLEKELLSRRVSYTGEEFGICHPLTFKQVLPALPPKEHGGVIDILGLVSSTTRELLLHPEKLEVEDVGQELPKLQGKVHVKPGELDAIANELVERGVCVWFPLEKVKRIRGVPVLNGLFWRAQTDGYCGRGSHFEAYNELGPRKLYNPSNSRRSSKLTPYHFVAFNICRRWRTCSVMAIRHVQCVLPVQDTFSLGTILSFQCEAPSVGR